MECISTAYVCDDYPDCGCNDGCDEDHCYSPDVCMYRPPPQKKKKRCYFLKVSPEVILLQINDVHNHLEQMLTVASALYSTEHEISSARNIIAAEWVYVTLDKTTP